MTDPDITQIGQLTAGIMRARTVEITPPAMLDRAIAQNAPVEVLERLIALKERWDAAEARKAFDTAFALAKAETPAIIKTQEVKYGNTSYRHEDLAEVLKAVDDWLAKFSMFVRFRTSSEPGQPVRVTCIVSHRDGYREENTLCAAPDTGPGRNSVQAVGSTITYLCRFTLKAALGLAASKDDDGRGGQNKEEPDHDAIKEWDDKLANAALQGTEALRKIWDEVPTDLKSTLKSALDNRHKPSATEEDRKKHESS